MTIISLDQHPLLMQHYRLMRKTDALPCHPEQTDLITKLGAWGDQLKGHLDKHGLLREPRRPYNVPEGHIRVVKVRAEQHAAAPALIVAEDELEMLWDYVEDWNCKLFLELTTMPRADVDALPEFDGF